MSWNYIFAFLKIWVVLLKIAQKAKRPCRKAVSGKLQSRIHWFYRRTWTRSNPKKKNGSYKRYWEEILWRWEASKASPFQRRRSYQRRQSSRRRSSCLQPQASPGEHSKLCTASRKEFLWTRGDSQPQPFPTLRRRELSSRQQHDQWLDWRPGKHEFWEKSNRHVSTFHVQNGANQDLQQGLQSSKAISLQQKPQNQEEKAEGTRSAGRLQNLAETNAQVFNI